jgi:hypothetical protein
MSMLNLENIQKLLDYKMVELSLEEQNFVKEMGFGYALQKDLLGSEDKFYLEYHSYLYKDQEELMRDAKCLYATFKYDSNIKTVMQYFFEQKVIIFKPLYNQGFTKFWEQATTPTFININ